MSRYVDLDGVSWDGKPISSKIQEVQTKHGYMQGITIGWLWGDNVPHIDLEEHDKQIRANAINDLSSIVLKELREIAKDEDYYFDNDNLILVSSVILTNAEKLKE